MSKIKLRFYPDKILRAKCTDVETIDADFRQIVHDMIAIMNRNRGLGLSAPQVGLSKNFFVWTRHPGVVLAPMLIKSSPDKQSEKEGCLSIPKVEVVVPRFKSVTINAFDINGKEFEQTYEGLDARIIQHEMDHLKGRLIIDYERRPTTNSQRPSKKGN